LANQQAREVAASTATPCMGFNLGSTKVRQRWNDQITRHYFESPLIRLMNDWGYRDAYADGLDLTEPLPAKSITIHRYYDSADGDYGNGETPSIQKAAREFRKPIACVRDRVCGNDAAH